VPERSRILFVDDEPGLRLTLSEILMRHGFEVVSVCTVAEAITAISQSRFDILLSDLNIGEPGDGFTVVSAMRRTQPEARAFILTGYPDFDTALRAIRNQVDDYFVKPADPDKLVATLQQKVNGPKHAYGPLKRVSQLLQELQPAIIQSFTERVMTHAQFRRAGLGEQEITEHVPAVLSELTRRVRGGAAELSPPAVRAAAEYGRGRRRRNYSVTMLVAEWNSLENVISATLQNNLLLVEMSTLVPDMIAIGETLNCFIEEAVRGFSHVALTHTA